MTNELKPEDKIEYTDGGSPAAPDYVDPPETIPEIAPKRGRGRPPKTENPPAGDKPTPAKKTTKRNTSNNVDVLSQQLVGMHMIMAGVTGLNELIITPQESTMLATSIISVAEEYNLALDGKTGAALQLFMTAAMVYAPRAIAVYKRSNKPAIDNVG